MSTIYVDHQDLDSVANAKEAIVKQVKAIEKKPADIETPISVSIDLQNLKQSENPEQRSLGDLLTVVTEIRTGLANVEKRLDNPIDPLAADQISVLEQQFVDLYLRIRDLEDDINELSALDYRDPATPEKLSKEMAKLVVLVHRVSMELSFIQERIAELSTRGRRRRSPDSG